MWKGERKEYIKEKQKDMRVKMQSKTPPLSQVIRKIRIRRRTTQQRMAIKETEGITERGIEMSVCQDEQNKITTENVAIKTQTRKQTRVENGDRKEERKYVHK